jgi:hypothetical protein
VRTVPAVFGFAPVRTDPDGKSRLGALQGQRVDVRFDGEVPAAGGIVVDLGGKRLVIGESGHTRLGDLRAAASVLPGSEPILLRAERVTRRADLEVRVVADGRPLEGAHVIAFPSLPYEPGPTQVETDLSGRAVLRGLPVWPTDVLVKWIQPGTIAHGGPPNLEAVLRAPMEADAMPGGPPLVVRMERVAVLRGRVVDPSGEPVAKAWCGACEGASCVAAFPTDAEGRFTSISNVAPGTRLQISARFPMDRPVACGVLDDVLAGEGELRIVLRPVPGR